jgi:hypothetical protein
MLSLKIVIILMKVSTDTVQTNVQITTDATSNNQAAYLDGKIKSWGLLMPLLGTLKVSVQTSVNDAFAVSCPFYKQGMPIGLSCSDPNVFCSVSLVIPGADVPCDGAFVINVNTSGEGVVLPVTLTLAVGV